MSIPPCRPEKAERDASSCGVNSKDLKRIEFPELGDEGADDDVSDAGEDVADVIGAAVEVPCTSRFPTDGANCRGFSPAMPTMRGLGLTESCRLARDIGYQTNGERDLPRFGALVEVKPLLPACLILIIEYIVLQWGSR
jgi:hypothetical protein